MAPAMGPRLGGSSSTVPPPGRRSPLVEHWLAADPQLPGLVSTAPPTSIRERREGPEARFARPGTPSWRLKKIARSTRAN